MSLLQAYQRTLHRWTPTSYSVDQTFQIHNVVAGDVVRDVYLQVDTAFDGTGGRTVSVGDSGDVDRFLTTTNGDLSTATTGYIMGTGGSGSTYTAIGRHLYTAADTIDHVFTAATGGSPTAGVFSLRYYIASIVAA